MTAFTLRLETGLARQLDRVCRERGYKKTGLVKALIRDFLDQLEDKSVKRPGTEKNLKKLVGIVTLGGDAVADADAYFE